MSYSFSLPYSESKYPLHVGWNESPPARHKSPETWSILDYSVKTQGEGRREEGEWEDGGGKRRKRGEETGGRRREEKEEKGGKKEGREEEEVRRGKEEGGGKKGGGNKGEGE